MYSIFFSNITNGFDLVLERLKELIKSNCKVTIFPWSFPCELDSDKLLNDYFARNGKRYNKYVERLKKIGINESNITIADCYGMESEKIKKLINSSDVLLFTGGNPEMFFNKVVHKSECLYDIKHYKGIIVGESAGTLLQQERYFITAKNNYYKYFAFYDGFGVINDPFYIDVHSIRDSYYVKKLKNIANSTKKCVYQLFNDGVIIYNRENNDIELYGNVNIIN